MRCGMFDSLLVGTKKAGDTKVRWIKDQRRATTYPTSNKTQRTSASYFETSLFLLYRNKKQEVRSSSEPSRNSGLHPENHRARSRVRVSSFSCSMNASPAATARAASHDRHCNRPYLFYVFPPVIPRELSSCARRAEKGDYQGFSQIRV